MKITTRGTLVRPFGKTIGYDPDLPTGDAEVPVDLSDDASWYVPYTSVATPGYVQHKRATVVGGVATTTLDAVPEPGNLLVHVIPLRENIGTVPVLSGTGWSALPIQFTGAEDGNWPLHVYWRVVQSGDGAVWTADITPTATGIMAIVIELSGVSSLDEDTGDGDTTGEGTISITPVTTNPVVLLSAVSVRDDATDIAYTPASGMTEIVDDQLTPTVAGPNIGINYRVVSAPSGSYTVGSTLSYTGSQRAVTAASFTASGEVIWLDAFAANDDDNATFDYALEASVTGADLVFLRGILTSDFILDSIVLRLALEDAGSVTVTVEGATDSVFTTPDIIGTLTFTGTGTYTAQSVTITCDGDAGYEHIRFSLGAAQGVRVHEVTLYGPTLESSHSHTHDHDDDYLTIADGGGDMLSTVAASGATETIDLVNGNVHQVTLTANCIFTFTAPDATRARSFRLYLWQDATGGWTTTWPGSVEWAGAAPTLDTTAETLSVFMFETLDGGTVWHGYAIGGSDPATTRWEPVVFDPGTGPEIVFFGGDIVMHEVPL